jgi:hypothetical protein
VYGNRQSCEIIVIPETLENIAAAVEACNEEGIRTTTAKVIGNFAIDLTEDQSLADVRKVISGEVIE